MWPCVENMFISLPLTATRTSHTQHYRVPDNRVSRPLMHVNCMYTVREASVLFFCFVFFSVSMALKLHEKRTTTVTRSTTALWQDHLLKFSSRVVLDLTAIIEIKKGLEFGRLLKLPTDLTFNYPRMAEFIVAGKRPLSHVE